MKYFFLLALITVSALAEPQPCSGQFTIAPSDEGGFVFSGNVTEGTYNSPKTSFHDDDGFLTLAATNSQILSSNNVYSGSVTNYRISDAEKDQIVRSLEAQVSYNAGLIQQLRDMATRKEQVAEGSPTQADLEKITQDANDLIAYVRAQRTNVPAAEWNSKVGKYINTGMHAGRVYTSLIPGLTGENYQMGLCGNLVRCLCEGNKSPFLRGRLCGIDHENPKANTGEFARCSYFNVSVQQQSSGNNSSQPSNGSRTQAQ